MLQFLSHDIHVKIQGTKKMAGEDDVELRDLVAHTLETRGVLGNIRVSNNH